MAKRSEPPVADVPLTSSRALRVATTRAAEKSLGLSLSVSSVGEALQSLDSLIEDLPSNQMYLALMRGGSTVGVLGLDTQMRAASIEMQTMGKLSTMTPAARAHTQTDLMLVAPLCGALLMQLHDTTRGSELEGWVDEVSIGGAFENLRAAGLVLEDAEFRIMKLTLDLGVSERQAELCIALPNHQAPLHAETMAPSDHAWDVKMHESVSWAPTTLTAILHKMTLPLGLVNGLKVGDVLPLYGAAVGSVRLYAPEGVFVTEARLGQSGGKRAIRIEAPAETSMRDLPAPKARAVAEVG